MTDRDRLLRLLRNAARPKKRKPIVCYDAAWAGLPRVTVHDRPRRVRRRAPRAVVVRSARRIPAPAAEQLVLL